VCGHSYFFDCLSISVYGVTCRRFYCQRPFIVCQSLRLFTSSLMDSFIVCVRLSYVSLSGCLHRHLWTVVLSASLLLFASLLECSHCHLWTVVLSASLCSFLPLCPQVVHTVSYGKLYCPLVYFHLSLLPVTYVLLLPVIFLQDLLPVTFLRDLFPVSFLLDLFPVTFLPDFLSLSFQT